MMKEKVMNTTNPTIDYLKTIPEIQAMKGVMQGSFHTEGCTLTHTELVLKHIQEKYPDYYELQLAALFHDIGKPKVKVEEGGKTKFFGHDRVGSRIAYEIFKREGVQIDIAVRVSNLIDNHMRPHLLLKNPTHKAIKKFLLKCGDDLEDILELCEADCFGKLPFHNSVPKLREVIKEYYEKT